MAAARDQAARILRPEPDAAEGEAARDASAALADRFAPHVADETVARRTADAPASRQAGRRRRAQAAAGRAEIRQAQDWS